MTNGIFARPEQKASTLDKIGLGLAAFGEGVQGRGQQFLRGQEVRRQALSLERQQAAAEDLRRSKLLLDAGDVSGVRDLLANRVENISALGGDPTETLQGLNLAEQALTGDGRSLSRLNSEIMSGLQSASDAGIIKLEQVQQPLSAAGKIAADVDRGFLNPDVAKKEAEAESEALNLRDREISLKEAAEKRMANRLSASSEKALLSSQENVQKLQYDSNSFDNLADEFGRIDAAAGFRGSLSEFLKSALGTQDEVSNLRRRFNAIRSSSAIKNLPPGPASDKDIELALKGFPTATANVAEIQSFLRGAAKVARIDAGWNQFKSDFLSERGNPKNMNKTWRKKIKSPVLGRIISNSEIYITAQNRGVTPEEVKNDLGIE